MTAPDPRLDEIQARLSAATPGPWFQGREDKRFEDARDVYTEREVTASSRDIGRIDYPEDAAFIANAPADVAYLLTELRKAHEALARVEGLCTEWEVKYGPGSKADAILGPQKVSIKHAVTTIRAAVAAANGDAQ